MERAGIEIVHMLTESRPISGIISFQQPDETVREIEARQDLWRRTASFGWVVEAGKTLRHLTVKLSRTTNYNFGWLLLIGLVDLAFLLAFFLLLSSNFILQQGISISMPFSRFSLGPQSNQQIISITGGAVPAIYFQDQRVTMEQLGPLLDAAKRKDQSIIIKADRSASYETSLKWRTLRSNTASRRLRSLQLRHDE
jgi:Biopolymer transport protein